MLNELVSKFARPALFKLDPEKAHQLSITGLKSGLLPSSKITQDQRLKVSLGGLDFPNPLGLAAGYDKNAEVPDAILKLGFGFTEVGTITPRAQSGNPKPRIFRLVEDEAVINRLGFNNDGHEAALSRLLQRQSKGGIVGVNIGANKDSEDFVSDYETGIECFYKTASYFTANISSPNTPGLRNLQAGDALKVLSDRIFEKEAECAKKYGRKIPIFLKIAPDLNESEMDEITGVVNASQFSALIVSNTTLDRDGLNDKKQAAEAGGLSGKPLFEKSTIALAKMRERINKDIPLIGVGGIFSANDVVSKIEAGASLVQIYTGLIYGGPCLPSSIVKDLSQHLDKTGISTISELIGAKTSEWSSR